MRNLNSLKKEALFFFLMIVIAGMNGQSFTGKLGINLGKTAYVDLVKQTNRVNYDDSTTQVQLHDTMLDVNGWPKCDFVVIWDHRPVKEWDGEIDDLEKYRWDMSGTYKGSFNGQADLVDWEPHGAWVFQNKVYDALTNKTTFEVVMSAPGPHHGLITIAFRNTKRTAASPLKTGITNLKFIIPGYDTASNQIFVNELYTAAKEASFSTVRAMSLTGTTSMKITYPDTLGWNTRKLLTDPWWGGGIGKKKGAAPWEVLIDFCNQSNMDMWINIPIPATDDYITQLAALIKDRLKNTLNVYIEIDNEVWGYADQKAYNEAEAVVNKINATQNYARRLYKAAKIFETVFGAGSLNNQIRPLLQGWEMVPGELDKMCDYITKTYGAVNQYVYGIGVSHYFGGSLMGGKVFNATVEDIVISSYTDAIEDTSMYKMINNIAKKYNLTAKGMVSYEGGPAMCDPINPIPKTAGVCINAYRDSCMAASVRRLYQNYVTYNGVLGNYFTLGGGYFSRYGCWGLTDDLKHTNRTSLMKCMQELLGDVTSPTPPADLFALKRPDHRYKLVWKDQSSDESGFLIERKDTGGKYILVKQVPANTTIYVDSVVYYNPKYYRVKAFNVNGTSTYANLALVIDSTSPPPPTNLKDSVISKSVGKLWWNKAKWENIKEYRVYKDGTLLGATQDTSFMLYGLLCRVYKLSVVTVSTSNIYSVPSDTITIQSCSGLQNISDQIMVFPNPTSDKVTIKLKNEDRTILSLMDFNGRILQSVITWGTDVEFDLSAYPQGIYLIRIRNNSGTGVAEVQKL